MIRTILITLFLFTFSSCQKPFIDENKFGRLAFTSTGCYGECPSMRIEISNDKSYKFIGISFTDLKGCFNGIMSDSLYDELINQLKKVQNEKKKEGIVYLDPPADAQKYCFKFFNNTGTEIKQDWLTNTSSLASFLLESYKKVELTKNDSLILLTLEFENCR